MLIDEALSILNLTMDDLHSHTTNNISKVYHSFLLKYHPDRNKPLQLTDQLKKEYESKFKQIRMAYDTIKQWMDRPNCHTENEISIQSHTDGDPSNYIVQEFYTGFSDEASSETDRDHDETEESGSSKNVETGESTKSDKIKSKNPEKFVRTQNSTDRQTGRYKNAHKKCDSNGDTKIKKSAIYHNIFNSTTIPFYQYSGSAQERSDLRSLYLLFRDERKVLRHAIWVEGRREYLKETIREIAEVEKKPKKKDEEGDSKGYCPYSKDKMTVPKRRAKAPVEKIKKFPKIPSDSRKTANELAQKKTTIHKKKKRQVEEKKLVKRAGKITNSNENPNKSTANSNTEHSNIKSVPISLSSEKPPKSDPSFEALSSAIFAQQNARYETMIKKMEQKFDLIITEERRMESKKKKKLEK